MRDFAYIVPKDLAAAASLLHQHGAGAVLKAGGVDLIDLMKEGISAPENVIDLLRLGALARIEDDPSRGLTIGPLATLDAIASHPAIMKRYSVLSSAAGAAATPQIRNVATIGGNLCQRPRCWYFRSADFPCLKKGGEVCYAVEGDNRYHAIFGDGPCHIVAPSSTGLALTALGASIETESAQGRRTVGIESFFVMPDGKAARETDLRPGEIVAKIRIPPPASGTAFAYVKVREKESFDWPIAEAAVALEKGAAGTIRSARIVLGAVAPVPWRSLGAEKAITGKVITAEVALEAAAAAVAGATPMSRNGYKVDLAREVVRRAVLEAAGRS